MEGDLSARERELIELDAAMDRRQHQVEIETDRILSSKLDHDSTDCAKDSGNMLNSILGGYDGLGKENFSNINLKHQPDDINAVAKYCPASTSAHDQFSSQDYEDVPGSISSRIQSKVKVRLQEAQIKSLSDDTDSLHSRINLLEKINFDASAKLKKLAQEHGLLSSHLKQKEIEATSLKHQLEQTRDKLSACETEAKEVSIKVRKLESISKKLESEAGMKDKMIMKTQEDKDKVKNSLKDHIEIERAEKGKIQSQLHVIRKELDLLKIENAHMRTGFQKQAKLIDVLKRQNIHLEATKMLAFTEQEFTKILKPDS